MKFGRWPFGSLALAVGIGACKPYPTTPVFRSPRRSSVHVVPLFIGQSDSVSVAVVASDPDDASLVYDGFTYGE